MAKKQTTKSATSKKEALQFKKEGNAYDKILKENIEKIFRPLIEQRLGIKIGKAIPLKEKMQTTVELEMDFFYEIVSIEGNPFILHLEFESGNNLEMVYRVGEYHGISLRREKLPIRHVVVYLGSEKPTMRTQLKPEEVYTGFDLLDISSIDKDEFLSSEIPEVVLMAVLGKYKPEEKEAVLLQILNNLRKLVQHKKTLQKYVNQLMMISRLRKMDNLITKISEDMPIHIDIKTDALYLKGEEKGLEKSVIKLCQKGMEASMIANLLDLPVEQVKHIIATFQNKQNSV